MTAFIYNGLVARPFWNASIFGAAVPGVSFLLRGLLVILIYQIVRRYTAFHVRDGRSSRYVPSSIAYAMAINLFLLLAEFYKELYSGTHHLSPLIYLYKGLHGKGVLTPFVRTAMCFNLTAFLIFLIPREKELRHPESGLRTGVIGIWIEKGIGLIIPGSFPRRARQGLGVRADDPGDTYHHGYMGSRTADLYPVAQDYQYQIETGEFTMERPATT